MREAWHRWAFLTHFPLENTKCWIRGGQRVLCGHCNNRAMYHLVSSPEAPCREECQICWVSQLHTQAQNTRSSQCQAGWTQHALCPLTISSERKEGLKESRKMGPPRHPTAATNVMLHSGPDPASCLTHPSTLHQSHPLSILSAPRFYSQH